MAKKEDVSALVSELVQRKDYARAIALLSQQIETEGKGLMGRHEDQLVNILAMAGRRHEAAERLLRRAHLLSGAGFASKAANLVRGARQLDPACPDLLPEAGLEAPLARLREAWERGRSERQGPQDAMTRRFDTDELSNLRGKVAESLRRHETLAIRAEGDPRARPSVVLGMDAILDVLPHLRFRPGWILRGWCYRGLDDGWGRVAAFPQDTPAEVLEAWAVGRVAEDTRALPALEGIEGDGSLESYMEASILTRELDEFGSFGHCCGGWSSHAFVRGNLLRDYEETVADVKRAVAETGGTLDEASRQLVLESERARRGCEALARPAGHPGVEDWGAWARRLEDGDVVVRFVTRTDQGRVACVLSEDRYGGGELGRIERSATQIALGQVTLLGMF